MQGPLPPHPAAAHWAMGRGWRATAGVESPSNFHRVASDEIFPAKLDFSEGSTSACCLVHASYSYAVRSTQYLLIGMFPAPGPERGGKLPNDPRRQATPCLKWIASLNSQGRHPGTLRTPSFTDDTHPEPHWRSLAPDPACPAANGTLVTESCTRATSMNPIRWAARIEQILGKVLVEPLANRSSCSHPSTMRLLSAGTHKQQEGCRCRRLFLFFFPVIFFSYSTRKSADGVDESDQATPILKQPFSVGRSVFMRQSIGLGGEIHDCGEAGLGPLSNWVSCLGG